MLQLNSQKTMLPKKKRQKGSEWIHDMSNELLILTREFFSPKNIYLIDKRESLSIPTLICNVWGKLKQRSRDMEDVNRTPREAKDYYSRSIWLSETAQAFGNLKRSDRDNVNGRDSYGYNFQEIVTPEVSGAFDEIKGLIRVNDEVIGEEENGDYGHYSRQSLTTEIVEIVEDGKSISNKDRRVDDLYVAVGKDDLNVVKWALDHAVSPGSRIFLIHVSSPITLIPTPGNN